MPELVALVSSLTTMLGRGNGGSSISVTQIEVVQLGSKRLNKHSNTLCLLPIAYSKAASSGVLRKSCSEDMQQVYRRTPLPKFNFNEVATLLKSHFVLQICCILSENLFLKTPLDGCFCLSKNYYTASYKQSTCIKYTYRHTHTHTHTHTHLHIYIYI